MGAAVAKVVKPAVRANATKVAKQATYATTKEATAAAKNLGYIKTSYTSNGQAVYYNSKTKKYITMDIDSHNGGVWKMADSVKNLSSKKTRIGTYDANLKRIGD